MQRSIRVREQRMLNTAVSQPIEMGSLVQSVFTGLLHLNQLDCIIDRLS